MIRSVSTFEYDANANVGVSYVMKGELINGISAVSVPLIMFAICKAVTVTQHAVPSLAVVESSLACPTLKQVQ